jgi:Fur family transcriptional regulator, zinc uptake regulator
MMPSALPLADITSTSSDVYYQRIIDGFSRAGGRLTRTRKLVAMVVATAAAPLSAYDIKDAVHRQGERIDVVSVYRILDVLDHLKLINRVPTTQQVFRADPEDSCSHHPVFICNTCGSAQELPWHGAHQLMQEMAAVGQVTVTALSVELRGQCRQCLPFAQPHAAH